MTNVTSVAPATQPSPKFLLLKQYGKVHRARLAHRLEGRPLRAKLCSEWLPQINRQIKQALINR